MYPAQIPNEISVHLAPFAQHSHVSLPEVRAHQHPIMQVIAEAKRRVPTYRESLVCPMAGTDSTWAAGEKRPAGWSLGWCGHAGGLGPGAVGIPASSLWPAWRP